MAETAQLKIGDAVYEFPLTAGTENERGFDIRKLRTESGVVTLDNGFVSTASCSSSVTFLNGEEGILRYRGYPIEQLAENSTFLETCYLLIYGELPNQTEFNEFRSLVDDNAILHEDIRRLIEALPATAHPMAALSSVINVLSSVYGSEADDPATLKLQICRLISIIRSIAAGFFRRSTGRPLVPPQQGLSYCGNFLRMMFSRADRPFEVSDDVEKALDLLLILHADHEQNCSTSTVRLVGSSQADLFASIAAGVNALSGPLHGGANQAVIEMLERIHADGDDVDKYVALAKDKDSNFRLMGFGHRVYKNFDPRALIIKKSAETVLAGLGVEDPLLAVAKRLETVAREDSYFVDRNLYPNVDFYSGIIYRALGIPTNMFTVMFAMGRLPGWIAQWKEMNEDPNARIGRPRQIYIGSSKRDYTALADRS